MNKKIPGGIYPTMLTPMLENGAIDYDSVEKLVEWYISKGVQGIFAMCQSSEMFFLNAEERVNLTRRVVEQVNGRVAVVASGHVSDSLEDQIEEMKRMADTGAEALVLVSNRLAAADESDDVYIERASRILDAVPEIPFGVYECPYPYKRLLTEKVIRWSVDTGRFAFMKDTCCDTELIRRRLEWVKGSSMMLFNANGATLLDTMKAGAAGYSGVMANFHPELYVWLYRNYKTSPEKADRLMNALGMFSVIEARNYPAMGKYSLMKKGLAATMTCRSMDCANVTYSFKKECDEMEDLVEYIKTLL